MYIYELNFFYLCRGYVTEEYQVNASISQSLADERLHSYGNQRGVYRLKISSTRSIDSLFTSPFDSSEITRCIPYNATDTELQSILNELSIVSSHGGVTVRRYGDGNDSSFKYGFTYRIDLDSPSTQTEMSLSRLDFDFYCYGYNNSYCGCAETKFSSVDSLGIKNCPLSHSLDIEGYNNSLSKRAIYSLSKRRVEAAAKRLQHSLNSSSLLDPTACVLPPTITVSRFSSLSYTFTSTILPNLYDIKHKRSIYSSVNRPHYTGQLIFMNGVHRLPPYTNLTVSVYGGYVISGNDYIRYKRTVSQNGGSLLLCGTSWRAWDSVNLLYNAPLSAAFVTYDRGFTPSASVGNHLVLYTSLLRGLMSICLGALGNRISANPGAPAAVTNESSLFNIINALNYVPVFHFVCDTVNVLGHSHVLTTGR